MIGKIISHYKILEKLGHGGMGQVYLAEDNRLLRQVALKFLPPDLVSDKGNRLRFIQEAQTASSLNHPNICVVHDIIDYDNSNYIVMEYVDGKTLRDILNENGAMREKDVIEIGLKICDALSAVHSKGILHRDIKPENIMISNSGYLKVMDFGLAKLAADRAEEAADQGRSEKKNKLMPENYIEDVVLSTLSGLLGTVSYMSPEQVQEKSVDQRSDIFSLGIVLYELLTGSRPFDGKQNVEILYSIVHEPVKPLRLSKSGISKLFESMINRCLEKELSERYQNIDDLSIELQNIKVKYEAELREKKIGKSILREPERRQMTLVFADLSNYDEVVSKIDVEEAASIVSDCYNMLTSVINHHNGKVDNISGGTIKLLFGAGSESEEMTKDAVNAAIVIRNKLKIFNEKRNLQIPIDIRMGINSGTVITGALGGGKTQNYMVMGDTVTFASQLKDIAHKDQILVSGATYKLTQNDFKYRELEPVSLSKGKEKAPLYELLSDKIKVHRPKLGLERQIFSEMVGREDQLRKLEEYVSRLIEGKGTIISVVGEAGIGKSRLISELKNKVDLSEITFLEGRALSIGKNLSFYPLTDVIKNWTGITEDDTETESAQKLESHIKNVYPEQIEEVFPFIGTMMGMELKGRYAGRIKGIKGEALEKLILKNLREFLGKAASQKPILFVMEDLHWADITSIEFLELLFRLTEKSRILFINVFRPGYKDTGERIIKTIKDRYPNNYEEIHLDSLNKNQGEMLINNLLRIKGFSPNIINLIAEQAGGNPFFIEEVVRSFIDEGLIAIRNDKFVVTNKIDTVIIPGTISEVLMGRIDKLDEETKTLIKTASVIGRNFFYKIIAEVAKTTEELEDRLTYLEDVQLIIEHKRMDEIEYLFKHALAQEAAYESILLKKRKEIHIKTAAAIETVFAEKLSKFYGLLSYHYSKGEDLDKAEEYLIKAGVEALKTSASGEAIEYFKDALNLYIKKYGSDADSEKKFMLEYNIAMALQNKGRLAESTEYFYELMPFLKLTPLTENIPSMIKVLFGFIKLVFVINFPNMRWKKVSNEYDLRIQKFYMDFFNSIVVFNPKTAFLEMIVYYGIASKFSPQYSKYIRRYLGRGSTAFVFVGLNDIGIKMASLNERFLNKNNKIDFLTYQMEQKFICWCSGDWLKSKQIEYDEKLLNEVVKKGELLMTTIYVNQFLMVMSEFGDYDSAKYYAEKMDEIGNTYEYAYALNLKYTFAARLFLKFRKFDEAFREIEAGIKLSQKTEEFLYIFTHYAFKARIFLMQNNPTEAEKELKVSMKLKSLIKVPEYLSEFFTSLLYFNMYYLEESIRSGDKISINRFKKESMKSGMEAYKNSKKFAGDRIEIYRIIGTYYWLIDKQNKAIKWWDKSIKSGEFLGGRLELSRTFWEVGKRLLEKRSKYTEMDGITAEEYLEKARVLFEEMNLSWDLSKIQEVEAS